MSELRIDTETVCFIIAKARAFDVKVAPSGMEAGSNAIDDDAVGALENTRQDPVEAELRQAIQTLNGAELADLIGLMRLGRYDGSTDDWPEVMRSVEEEPPEHPVDAMIGTPLLGDYLEAGLDALGVSCTEAGETARMARFKAE